MSVEAVEEPVVPAPAEERRVRRRKVKVDVAIAVDGQLVGRGRMVDFSDAGARIEGTDAEPPERFYVVDIGAAVAYRARVVWRKGRVLGVAFLHAREVEAQDTPEWIATLWREMRQAA